MEGSIPSHRPFLGTCHVKTVLQSEKGTEKGKNAALGDRIRFLGLLE